MTDVLRPARPPLVSIVVAFWIGWAPLAIRFALDAEGPAAYFRETIIVIEVLKVIALVGYWRMERWGVYLYTLLCVCYLGFDLVHGITPLGRHLLFFVNAVIGFMVIEKMKPVFRRSGVPGTTD